MEEKTRLDVIEAAVLDLLEDLSKTQERLAEIQHELHRSDADALATGTRLATTETSLRDARVRLARAEVQLQDVARPCELQGVRREIFENKADVLRWLAGSLAIGCVGGVIFVSTMVGNISPPPTATPAPIIINIR